MPNTRQLEETIAQFMLVRTELCAAKKHIASLRSELLAAQRTRARLEEELSNLRALLVEIEADMKPIKKTAGE